MISFFELHGLEHFSRNSRLWERGGQQNEGREGMGAGCRQPQKLNEPRKCRREVPTSTINRDIGKFAGEATTAAPLVRWEASVVVNHVNVWGASRRRSGRSLIARPIAPAS
jgi:hypothetical protein